MKFLLFCILLWIVSTTKILPNDPNFSYSGRINKLLPDKYRFDWPGISIRIKFSGKCLTLLIKDNSGRNAWNVIIDGIQTILFTNTATTEYKITCSLDAKMHELLIMKRTETILGSAEFLGIQIDDEAKIEPIMKPERRIEFYGDSFTAGFGNEGVHPCEFSKETQNIKLTYGAMISENMNAEYHIQAISGIGMVRNYGSPNTTSPNPMPLYFRRVVSINSVDQWNFKSWVPQAVVIFLGINDYSTQPFPSESQFKSGYINFLNMVFKEYPNTRVFTMCYSIPNAPHCGYIESLIQEYPIRQIDFILLRNILNFPQDFGCSGHPNVAGHRKVAKVVEPVIRQRMNWN